MNPKISEEFEISEQLCLISEASTIQHEGYLYVQRMEESVLMDNIGALESISDIFRFTVSQPLKSGITFKYDISKIAMEAEETF